MSCLLHAPPRCHPWPKSSYVKNSSRWADWRDTLQLLIDWRYLIQVIRSDSWKTVVLKDTLLNWVCFTLKSYFSLMVTSCSTSNWKQHLLYLLYCIVVAYHPIAAIFLLFWVGGICCYLIYRIRLVHVNVYWLPTSQFFSDFCSDLLWHRVSTKIKSDVVKNCCT